MKNLLIIILLSSSAVFALPGDLDTTFGVSGGHVISDFLGLQAEETVNDVVVQPDGKIIIAGSVTPSVNLTDFLVARYNVDGTLDTTFSGDGVFTLNHGGADEVHAIALQSDGKIVAVGEWGSSGSNFVFRLNANGSLDTTFGGGTGRVQVVAGKALSVAIQPGDGKIIVGGYTNLNEATICRLNPDSSLDTSFDTDGVAFFTQIIRANSVAIQPNGRIVFTGSFGGDTATARLLSNGTLDSSFDGDGVAITAVYAGTNEGDAILVQIDGKILVSGGGAGTSGGALLVRYNSNGTLDNSFDGDGIRLHVLNVNGSNFYNDLAQQADGKILAIGSITYSLLSTLIRESFTLSRFNTDGALDGSFDGNGKLTSQWCENASGMFLQSDGKIVAVGREDADSDRGTCTQRFNADGSVDPSLNFAAGDGTMKQTVLSAQEFTSVEAVAGLPDGKILVAGWGEVLNQSYTTAKLVRLKADGTLDTSFMDEGIFEYTNSTTSTYFNDLKVLSDGGFLVAGEVGIPVGGIVAKFTPAGTLDTTFSGDGVATVSAITRIYAVAVQTDGKIIGCGSNGSGLATRSSKLIRLSASGTLEQDTFSNFGNANNNEIFECALQSDGKLIVAGYGNDGTSDFIGISRKLTSFTGDTTFGTNGIVTTDMSAVLNDRATGLVVQADNKIVVSSVGLNTGGDRDFAVLRYEPNGTLDPNFTENFGTNGISLINFGLANPNDEAHALLIQPDGQMIAVGASNAGTGDRFGLAKLNANGSPALGFGTLGRTITVFPNNDARINDLSFYLNDKIITAGRTWNGTDYDFAVARYQNELLPTAAAVSISGRVSAPNGSGILNVIVTLTDTNGNLRTARTGSFGYFRFDAAPVGETYIISVISKRFTFKQPTQILTVNEEVTDINFIALE